MTTMFVQLRRVVYLLVLLQCCVCVASASGKQEVFTVKSTKDAAEVEWFRKTVDEVYKHIVHTNGCLSVLKDKRQLTTNNTARARAVVKNVTDLVVAFMELNAKEEGRGQIGAWIEERKDEIQQHINDLEVVMSSLLDMSLLSDNCRKQSMVSDDDMNRLDDARKRFLKVPRKETTEIVGLRLGSRIVSEKLFDLLKDLKSPEGGLLPLRDARESVNDAKRAMQALLDTFKDVKTFKVPSVEEMGEGFLRKAEGRNVTVIKELGEAKEKAKREIQRLLRERRGEEKNEKEVMEQDGSGVVEQPSTGIKETQEVDTNGQSVQEKEEKQVDSESAGKEEVVGGTAMEEQKEEIRKEDAPQQGVKIKEEANVTDIGAENVIKAIRESDSSSNPALVHASMLLLLCVLGCSLVC
ncbi:uncharacterized protein TM35_000054810 [Trypanosoma theileri]|uniref:Uncharacterized protein n=1 Tax=Trypanosoma theileri TaxID=67003 RepID=A0A1X0P4T6_9TRYP|nr:uncharacterized protein TM35_000054810 [Trypanosoma theileri]ORC91885.1 hypothetical protein TM35_000054810 [Trypanosoma theileri]